MAAGQSAAGLRENLQGICDAAGGKDADENAQEHGGQREKAGGALHFVNAAIGLGLRFLYDHGPVERRHWAVGAKHFDALGVDVNRELHGGDKLRFASATHEVAYDLQTLHVLACSELGSRCGDETALSVDKGRK